MLGFFTKRNIIALLLSVEIMLNAVNLTFVAFSASMDKSAVKFSFSSFWFRGRGSRCQPALVIAMFRNRESLNVDRGNTEVVNRNRGLQSLLAKEGEAQGVVAYAIFGVSDHPGASPPPPLRRD